MDNNNFIENAIPLKIGEAYSKAKETKKEVSVFLSEALTLEEQQAITQVSLTFGQRRYFVCNGCDHARSNLYLVGNVLRCRVCCNLTYENRNLHRNKLYEAVIRPANKAGRIEKLLNKRLRKANRERLLNDFKYWVTIANQGLQDC